MGKCEGLYRGDAMLIAKMQLSKTPPADLVYQSGLVEISMGNAIHIRRRIAY